VPRPVAIAVSLRRRRHDHDAAHRHEHLVDGGPCPTSPRARVPIAATSRAWQSAWCTCTRPAKAGHGEPGFASLRDSPFPRRGRFDSSSARSWPARWRRGGSRSARTRCGCSLGTGRGGAAARARRPSLLWSWTPARTSRVPRLPALAALVPPGRLGTIVGRPLPGRAGCPVPPGWNTVGRSRRRSGGTRTLHPSAEGAHDDWRRLDRHHSTRRRCRRSCGLLRLAQVRWGLVARSGGWRARRTRAGCRRALGAAMAVRAGERSRSACGRRARRGRTWSPRPPDRGQPTWASKRALGADGGGPPPCSPRRSTCSADDEAANRAWAGAERPSRELVSLAGAHPHATAPGVGCLRRLRTPWRRAHASTSVARCGR